MWVSVRPARSAKWFKISHSDSNSSYTSAFSSTSATNVCYVSIPAWIMNRAVLLRSSPVPHSLSRNVSPLCQMSLCMVKLGQSCIMCSGVCCGAPYLQVTESLRPIQCTCVFSAHCPVQGLKILALAFWPTFVVAAMFLSVAFIFSSRVRLHRLFL